MGTIFFTLFTVVAVLVAAPALRKAHKHHQKRVEAMRVQNALEMLAAYANHPANRGRNK